MANALICDSCEVPGTYEGELRPRGWYVVRVEVLGSAGYTLHACSSGCAIRALAAHEHEREHPQTCRVAFCVQPALAGREVCDEHARSLASTHQPPEVGRDDEGASTSTPDASETTGGLLCDETGCARLAIAVWDDHLAQARITCGEHVPEDVDAKPKEIIRGA